MACLNARTIIGSCSRKHNTREGVTLFTILLSPPLIIMSLNPLLYLAAMATERLTASNASRDSDWCHPSEGNVASRTRSRRRDVQPTFSTQSRVVEQQTERSPSPPPPARSSVNYISILRVFSCLSPFFAGGDDFYEWFVRSAIRLHPEMSSVT